MSLSKTGLFWGLLSLLVALSWVSCTKTTPFGADLLEDQSASLAATDTATLRMTVVPEEVPFTSDRTSTVAYLYVGQLNDPTVGKTTAELFTLLRVGASFTFGDFRNATIDSVIMALRHDSRGFYGDSTQTQTMRVYRLEERLLQSSPYRANVQLRSGVELGNVSFTPKPRTSTQHPFDASLTAIKIPHVRLSLDPAFGKELLSYDSLVYLSDSLFRDKVRGIRITSTTNNQPGAIMAFSTAETDNVSAITVYYKRSSDKEPRRQTFLFRGNNKYNRFANDFTGSAASQVLNKPNPQQMYVKGLGGLRLRVDVPYIKRLGNVAINKAELVLTVSPVANDFGSLSPAPQLSLTYQPTNDTTAVFANDLLYSLGSTGDGGFARFGGFPVDETVNGTAVKRYHINLTQHLQQMISGKSNTPTYFYINIIGNTANVYTSPARSVFYGPNHVSFAPKLNIKYTKVL